VQDLYKNHPEVYKKLGSGSEEEKPDPEDTYLPPHIIKSPSLKKATSKFLTFACQYPIFNSAKSKNQPCQKYRICLNRFVKVKNAVEKFYQKII
jgi:hypothetical protein